MQKAIQGFTGVSQSGYGIEICGGKHFSTPQGEFVEMKHGQEYCVKAINWNYHRSTFHLNIDGTEQGRWQCGKQSVDKIERPAEVAKKFTFYRVKFAPKMSGIQKGKAENGLITCIFTPEKNAAMMIQFGLSELRKNSTITRFKLFEMDTMNDLAREVRGILKREFSVEKLSDYVVLSWKSNEANSLVRYCINTEGDNEDEFVCHLDWEGIYKVCYLTCFPKIRTATVTHNQVSFGFNICDKSLSTLTEAIKERFGLESFFLQTKGRVFVHSSWAGKQCLYQCLRKDEIEEGIKYDCLNISVLEKLPHSSNGYFELAISMEKGYMFQVTVAPHFTIEEIKQRFNSLANIGPDQQRLTHQGKCLEDGRTVSDYNISVLHPILHLRLRLRGGGGGPAMVDTQSDDEDHTSGPSVAASAGTKRTAPDSDWRAGATTLGKKSKQEFVSVPALDVDHRKAVTLTVRLVARDDEMSKGGWQKSVDAECSPLNPSVPSPMPE